VDSPQAAKEKINLGANLIQIYTGLVFKGPGLIENILR
jgi:dihydroorotate dehydrogenase